MISAAATASHVLASPANPATKALLELTQGLAAGNDAAWARFHRDYGPALFRWLLGATRGDYDLASEALQQTYLRVARYARACDSEEQFLAWTRLLAKSALSDCRRRRRSFWDLLRRRAVEPLADDATDDRIGTALEEALRELAPDDRALLEEKYFRGRDVRSMAAAMSLSPKAVESRLTRARAALRAHLLSHLSHHE